MRVRLGHLALPLFFLGAGLTCGGPSQSADRDSTNPSPDHDFSDAPIIIYLPIDFVLATPTTDTVCYHGGSLITACEYDSIAAMTKPKRQQMEILGRHLNKEMSYVSACRRHPLSEDQAREAHNCFMQLKECAKLSSCLGSEYKPGPNNMRPLKLVPTR